MTTTQYAAKRLFTPNKKITIEYKHIVIDNKVYGMFSFFLSSKFVLSIHSIEYAWLEYDGILTNEKYLGILQLEILQGADNKTSKTLNKIIKCLNTLAKYDAN